MKPLLISLLFFSLTAPAMGQSPDCDAISDLAKSVMIGRQGDDPMSEMMGRVMKSDLNDYTKSVAKRVIISAYEKSRNSSDLWIRNSIVDFQSYWYMRCIKGQLDEK